MKKRKIQFKSQTYKKLIGKEVTVEIDTPIFRLRQMHIKTDLGYFDVTVSLDRKGRLKDVLLERSRSYYGTT